MLGAGPAHGRVPILSLLLTSMVQNGFPLAVRLMPTVYSCYCSLKTPFQPGVNRERSCTRLLYLVLHCSRCYNNFGNCSQIFFFQLMKTVLTSHALGPCLVDKTELQAESRNLLTEIVANFMLVNIERLVIPCFLLQI